jgi:PleD family two-component response regulator
MGMQTGKREKSMQTTESEHSSDYIPTILLVDDNPENLKVLAQMIEQQHYHAALATCGTDALSFLRDQTADLVLLDIMMPDMDGYQVCTTLKSNAQSRHLPVIFITARDDTESIVKGFRCGGIDYVTKPFNSEELMARVRTHVELKLARDELKVLRGILPVCANCKSIRSKDDNWIPMEVYLKENTEADFSHGLCPHCLQQLYPHLGTPVEEQL